MPRSDVPVWIGPYDQAMIAMNARNWLVRSDPLVEARRLEATPAFEWTVLLLSAWMLVGAYVDAWAHNHLPSALESFFTPWHALLYSGMAVTTIYLIVRAVGIGASPLDWFRALPRGYGLSLAGGILFAGAGVLDMMWHLTFGIEKSFAALISPTHLLLMLSAALLVSGGLRAGLVRGGVASYPTVLSGMLLLSLLTFFGQFDHPYTSQWAAGAARPFTGVQMAEELGVLGVIVQSALLMGVVLVLLRRVELPLGSMTLIIGINAAMVTMIIHVDPIILIGILAGALADVLLVLLRPSTARTIQLRIFAAAVPMILYALYFTAILSVDGIWWPVHVWIGSIALAGFTGWLMSLAMVPAPVSVEA